MKPIGNAHLPRNGSRTPEGRWASDTVSSSPRTEKMMGSTIVNGLLKISCWRLRLHTRRPGLDGLLRRDLGAGGGPDEKVGIAQSHVPTRPTLPDKMADAFGHRDRRLDSSIEREDSLSTPSLKIRRSNRAGGESSLNLLHS
jgi:hypothetical protein